VASLDRVLQRVTVKIDGYHVSAGGFHGLLNGQRHFTRLATTESHATVAVADRGQCGKTEDTATLDHLGYTINLDQFFLQAFFVLA